MKTRNFADVIKAKLEADPDLARAVAEAEKEEVVELAIIKDKFRKALRELLVGKYTSNNSTLWKVYREYLHDVRLGDLPEGRARDLWAFVVDAILDRFETNVDKLTGKPRQGVGPLFTEEEARQTLWEGNSESYYVPPALDNMGHARTKKIKQALFDIFDILCAARLVEIEHEGCW